MSVISGEGIGKGLIFLSLAAHRAQQKERVIEESCKSETSVLISG